MVVVLTELLVSLSARVRVAYWLLLYIWPGTEKLAGLTEGSREESQTRGRQTDRQTTYRQTQGVNRPTRRRTGRQINKHTRKKTKTESPTNCNVSIHNFADTPRGMLDMILWRLLNRFHYQLFIYSWLFDLDLLTTKYWFPNQQGFIEREDLLNAYKFYFLFHLQTSRYTDKCKVIVHW